MDPKAELSMDHLRRVANAFTESPWARLRMIGLPTLGTYAASDPLYFTRLAVWRQSEQPKYKVLAFLSGHWPEGSQWPPGIPRPEYSQTAMFETFPQASPAPWHYRRCKRAATIVDADGTTVGVVVVRHALPAMLAAPALLEALEALVRLDINLPAGAKKQLRLPDTFRWMAGPDGPDRTEVYGHWSEGSQIDRHATVASVSSRADARLMVAAWDLRAVLGGLRALYMAGELTAARSDNRRLAAAMRQADAAIAKAGKGSANA